MEQKRQGPPPELSTATLDWLEVKGPVAAHIFTKANTWAAHHPAALQQLPEHISATLPFVPYRDTTDTNAKGHGSLVTKAFVALVHKQCIEGNIAEVAAQFADVHHRAYDSNELERLHLESLAYRLVCTWPVAALSLSSMLSLHVLDHEFEYLCWTPALSLHRAVDCC